MEKVLTSDEKIRRMEELYYQKKIQAGKQNSARVNVIQNDKYGKIRKMVLQILICIVLYIIFYLIRDFNYIFSNDVINKTKEVLSYNTNFNIVYTEAIKYAKGIYGIKNDILTENIIVETDEADSNTVNMIEETLSVTEGTYNDVSRENTEVSSAINQMEEDVNKIKKEYSITKPLEGTITSRYGTRNPTTEGVSIYHTGIDIAADVGTTFSAAMEGTVKLVSQEGNYRKSYQNIKRRGYNLICTLQ